MKNLISIGEPILVMNTYIQLFEQSKKHNIDFADLYDVYNDAIFKLSERFQYADITEVGMAKVELFIEQKTLHASELLLPDHIKKFQSSVKKPSASFDPKAFTPMVVIKDKKLTATQQKNLENTQEKESRHNRLMKDNHIYAQAIKDKFPRKAAHQIMIDHEVKQKHMISAISKALAQHIADRDGLSSDKDKARKDKAYVTFHGGHSRQRFMNTPRDMIAQMGSKLKSKVYQSLNLKESIENDMIFDEALDLLEQKPDIGRPAEKLTGNPKPSTHDKGLVAIAKVAAAHPGDKDLQKAVKHLSGTHPEVSNALNTGIRISKDSSTYTPAQTEAKIKAHMTKQKQERLEGDILKHKAAVSGKKHSETASVSKYDSIDNHYDEKRKEYHEKIKGILAMPRTSKTAKQARTDAVKEFLNDHDHIVHKLSKEYSDADAVKQKKKFPFSTDHKQNTVKLKKETGTNPLTSEIHKGAYDIHRIRIHANHSAEYDANRKSDVEKGSMAAQDYETERADRKNTKINNMKAKAAHQREKTPLRYYARQLANKLKNIKFNKPVEKA